MSSFDAAIKKAQERGRPFIGYEWAANTFRDGQRSAGFLVVSLGEAQVPRVLTAAQERQKALGKKFSPTVTINIKPAAYEKDIEKLRKQGRLRRILYGGEDGTIAKEERYDDWGCLIE